LSNGILNPAVAIAMSAAVSPALWATLVGSIVGLLYSLFEQAKPPKTQD
jgi:hypothetical protein